MLFKGYLDAAAEVLATRFKGKRWQNQNSSDIGEISEMLIKDFLGEFLSSQFAILRGGHVVSAQGEKSKQMDIVLCSKNYPSIFADKGLYPLESVLGAFAVTSNLTPQKLISSVECLASIPAANPRFYYLAPWRGTTEPDEGVIQTWKKRVPYRCIFAFAGVLDNSSVVELNKSVDSGELMLEMTPNHIIVNQMGMIVRNYPGLLVNGNPIRGHFHHYDIHANQTPGIPLAFIINELTQVFAVWGSSILPKYNEYFSGG